MSTGSSHRPRRYGLVLPHFSQFVTRERILRTALAAEHVVFDLRPRLEDVAGCIQLLGDEVLPGLRADLPSPNGAARHQPHPQTTAR